jgi:hypothetical protein
MASDGEPSSEQWAELDELVAKARDAWAFFAADVAALKEALRRTATPALAAELRRIEAYGALEGRDEGLGHTMTDWLDEIADVIASGRAAAEMEDEDAP